MFKAIIATAAVLVGLTGPQLPALANSTECETLDSGALICVRSITATVDRLGVRDAQGRTEFIGDITCTDTQWILHGYKGYASSATARSYAKAYCEGRGDMFASLPSVLA